MKQKHIIILKAWIGWNSRNECLIIVGGVLSSIFNIYLTDYLQIKMSFFGNHKLIDVLAHLIKMAIANAQRGSFNTARAANTRHETLCNDVFVSRHPLAVCSQDLSKAPMRPSPAPCVTTVGTERQYRNTAMGSRPAKHPPELTAPGARTPPTPKDLCWVCFQSARHIKASTSNLSCQTIIGHLLCTAYSFCHQTGLLFAWNAQVALRAPLQPHKQTEQQTLQLHCGDNPKPAKSLERKWPHFHEEKKVAWRFEFTIPPANGDL